VPTAVAYRSYAKINLYLDVLGRRRDGYHDIETIFQSVSLADELTFTEESSRISLVCSAPELDTAESNLVYRAAMLLKERTGCPHGAQIRLDKRIPIAAGLAGGSGNAAATLVALNILWDLRLTPGQIREFAFDLGSDVPFCVTGGTVAAARRGEEMRSLPPLRRQWFVLLHPAMAVSASRVYNSPYLEYSHERPFAGRTPRFRKVIRFLQQGDLARVVFNRMEVPVFAGHPQLAEAKRKLLERGCIAAAMSGSGPTLFGVCRTRTEARKIADRFDDYRTSIVSGVPAGLERTE
jgi:4-diphosphocytidyl-2-C-methyl-D-erythritol kinase